MNPTATEQTILLENALRANGIKRVSITANDVYPSGNFAKGPGQVDLYGFDSYPNDFDRSRPNQWRTLADYYVSSHQSTAPWAPLYLPKF